MNNETKYAIERLEFLHDFQCHGEGYASSVDFAIKQLEKFDKVKFVTEKEIEKYCDENGLTNAMAKDFTKTSFKDHGILIEEEKRCRWTNGVVTTNTPMTEKELSERGIMVVYIKASWHPVKEEE